MRKNKTKKSDEVLITITELPAKNITMEVPIKTVTTTPITKVISIITGETYWESKKTKG